MFDYVKNNLKGQRFLRDEGFSARLKDYLTKKEAINKIPRVQRLVGKPALTSLFGNKPLSKLERNRKIYLAHVKSGYTLKGIAAYLEAHHTMISKGIGQISKN